MGQSQQAVSTTPEAEPDFVGLVFSRFIDRECNSPKDAVQNGVDFESYERCVQNATPKIKRVLLYTAGSKCRPETVAWQRCMTEKGSENCYERFGNQAMRCAGKALLEPGVMESVNLDFLIPE